MRGELPNENATYIAIVGTRKATHEGISIARDIARQCAKNGLTVVSGLALGIDGAAHEGALDAGGKTIAVLANGLDTVYPRQHESLAMRMIEKGGALISEYPEGSPAYPNQFLERNRIVAGISLATVVIEAPERSGSIATARIAAEAGREVFVIPGSVTSINYRGSHTLIRNGARLIRSADDMFEDLGFQGLFAPITKHTIETSAEHVILEALETARTPLSVDHIVELTGLEPHVVQEKLTLLALDGCIIEISGKFTVHA